MNIVTCSAAAAAADDDSVTTTTTIALPLLRADADIRDSNSSTPGNSKSTRLCGFSPCASSKPRHKAVLGCGAVAGDECGKKRTGVRLGCNQSHIGQQVARPSDKMADCAELSDSKNGTTN